MIYPILVSVTAGAVMATAVFYHYHNAKLAELREAHRVQIDAANLRAHNAAKDYAAWKAKHAKKRVEVIREVQQIVEVERDWADARIPDGVCELLSNAPADIDPSGADAAVPRITCSKDITK